ncbi:branched-chain amino acid transport system II carrier protein [Gallaecimonas sp. GXIMD4217]|uniref:branched-chain amino acid transport system II carrier protein n=1 Tax=Gallaecimonas sp. GXIMD4217 TaxID=3131927 RepID=UPI00311B42FE
MNNRLSFQDVLGLGFMTFAFFLGAGNMIFPPLAGQQAAGDLLPAILGFLLTAVGMPLLTIIAVARAGGGLESLSRILPKGPALALCVALYLILGPLFATPRTGLVAFELGMVPFLDNANDTSLAFYTLGFFGLTLLLALRPGKLLDLIGKVVTPVLILLLLVIAATLAFAPLAPVGDSVEAWQTAPLTKGFLEGYMTMDTLGALMFGLVIVHALHDKGINEPRAVFGYLVKAGLIAAAGLTLVYVSLFYLGATSHEVAANPDNGGAILVAYIGALFGPVGLYLLAAVVSLACLTTAVGLTSACAEYFSDTFACLNYKVVALAVAAGSALVANVGLSTLIAISVPVLFFIYPIAIALVALKLLEPVLGNRNGAQLMVLAVTAVFATLDGVKMIGIQALEPLWARLGVLPLFDQGLGWLVPSACAMGLMALLRRAEQVKPELA